VRIPIYQVDAFTSTVFRGNPAAVCPLDAWLDDHTLQAIGAENNLAETAFFVPRGKEFELRWFTPTTEVDLCGHATLASAFVLMGRRGVEASPIRFHSRSGPLSVTRDGARYALDFPAMPLRRCDAPAGLEEALGHPVVETLVARDLVVVMDSEDEVRRVRPGFDRLAAIDHFGIVVTAPGDQVDFVSRFFAPRQGVPEDPATGSSHCELTPFWAERLGKTALRARQLSARGGEFFLRHEGHRVSIAGDATLYMEGVIEV
jgi:PhzF family phenazine biosynthesis protein